MAEETVARSVHIGCLGLTFKQGRVHAEMLGFHTTRTSTLRMLNVQKVNFKKYIANAKLRMGTALIVVTSVE